MDFIVILRPILVDGVVPSATPFNRGEMDQAGEAIATEMPLAMVISVSIFFFSGPYLTVLLWKSRFLEEIVRLSLGFLKGALAALEGVAVLGRLDIVE